MSDLVTLILPPGEATWSYPTSHGEREYIPYRLDHTDEASLWAINVPREAAAPLLKTGGYTMAQGTVVVQTAALVRMFHPQGPRSFGWSPAPGIPGVSFDPDEDGVNLIPVEAVGLAQESFGFMPAPPAVEKPKLAAAPPPIASASPPVAGQSQSALPAKR